MVPVLKLAKVPLHGPFPQHIKLTPQLGVTCKHAQGALDPTACATDEDMEQSGASRGPWGTPFVTGFH